MPCTVNVVTQTDWSRSYRGVFKPGDDRIHMWSPLGAPRPFVFQSLVSKVLLAPGVSPWVLDNATFTLCVGAMLYQDIDLFMLDHARRNNAPHSNGCYTFARTVQVRPGDPVIPEVRFAKPAIEDGVIEIVLAGIQARDVL